MDIDISDTAGARSLGSAMLRSVIARPLQERIQCELDLGKRLEKLPAAFRKPDRTVILLNDKFEGGIAAARRTVERMLAQESRRGGSDGKAAFAAAHQQKAPDLMLSSLEQDMVEYLQALNANFASPIRCILPSRWDVIIDINLKFRALPDPNAPAPRAGTDGAKRSNPVSSDPRQAAKEVIREYIDTAKSNCVVTDPEQGIQEYKTSLSNQYVFARLEGKVLVELARIDHKSSLEYARRDRNAHNDARIYRVIHQIWPDFELRSCTHRSVRTVKADAAQNAFSAYGEGITWAVIDSGIDSRHPHFAMHANIDPASPYHCDFTNAINPDPLMDEKGHGTHVAGIISGQQLETQAPAAADVPPYETAWRMAGAQHERASGSIDDSVVSVVETQLTAIAGIAPKCKLVSLKVLNKFGHGKASNVIAAIAHIQLINGHGRDLKIHGVNLSLGHDFDAEWFACGHSPLCVEVNRLVKSGVVVVIAAGNSGYGRLKAAGGDRDTGLGLSINDPGNAELAITVGATHRDAPHMYGVSYFSSKGPTGDGRCKPDLIAPGERIISAAAADSRMVTEFGRGARFAYFESTGTSMAAPHVSGAVAAFLSIRSEFIGEAEKVKKIFTSTATDLGRERYFQGAGLVDLLRAIQSV